jgi:hypothetical protein
MRAKYSVVDSDFYNFDETGFIMGQICPRMVITRTDQRGKSKAVQPGNREWATVIITINSEGASIPCCSRRQPPRELVLRNCPPLQLGYQTYK